MSFTHRKKIHLLAAIVGLLALSAVAFAGSAAASLPSNCAGSAGTVTCTFSVTGATQDFTVPAGVTSATFDVAGAQGAGNSFGDTGGRGADVQGTLAVTAGEVLTL